jgi:hypothetical protein
MAEVSHFSPCVSFSIHEAPSLFPKLDHDTDIDPGEEATRYALGRE